MAAFITQMAKLCQHRTPPSTTNTPTSLSTPPFLVDPLANVESKDFKLLYKLLKYNSNTKIDVKPLGPFDEKHHKKTTNLWIFKLDIYFQNFDLPKPKKVTLASSLLKDRVVLWWQ